MGKIVIMEDNPGLTLEKYHEIAKKIGLDKKLAPGCHVHIVGLGPDGHLRVVDVWDSQEAVEAFLHTHVHPEREEHLTGGVVRQVWELEHLLVTDDKNHVTLRS